MWGEIIIKAIAGLVIATFLFGLICYQIDEIFNITGDKNETRKR